MKEAFLTALTVLFGLGGIVTFVGFFPTIRDLWNRKPSANAISYWAWGGTTLVTSLYGIFILHDLAFNIVINLQLLACIIVLVLRLRLPK